ncbi:MAG: ABC transporter permease [Actinobacteria bacterium]|nr:ABC transporter permease [Actinomycetota bacterium]
MANLRMAFSSIAINKGRSFLTMLGIIIGVGSVILILAIAEGAKRDVAKSIEGLGSNIVFVLPGKVQPGRFFSPGTLSSVLTAKDVSTIKGLAAVKDVSPLVIISNVAAGDGRTDSTALNIGVSDVTLGILNLKMERGRFLSKSEVDKSAPVAIVGAGPSSVLFPGGDAVGKTIIIKEKPFKVVGVLQKAPPTSSLGGANFDTMVMIPFTTANGLLGSTTIARIAATVRSGRNPEDVKEEIVKEVKKNHGGVEDFSVLTQRDILNTASRVIDAFTAMIASIAAISLVVGGIGIMNMMLVSVTERTREIGIRKAVGATSGNILFQFLSEAIALSFIGAIIGLGVAFAGSRLIGRVSDNLHPYISSQSIGLALAMAFFVGVVFGIIPAIRAARKNPIEALRYE